MASPVYFKSIDSCVDQIFSKVGKNIVLGIPLGIGKPNPLVNALYRRVKADQKTSLKIITALSLARPKGHSELQKRFLDPFATRNFGDYPDLDYVIDMQNGTLPQNIEVAEFFMKTGEYLNNLTAQQSYIYSNYSHAARDIILQGVNVLAQAVACRESHGKTSLSLSSNPDVTLDLLEMVRSEHAHILTVAMVNAKLPFMPNDAEVSADTFDFVVTDAAGTHDIFAAPNPMVTLGDHAIGLYCASLIPDGGTLQIGIGSLGDAVAHGLILRDKHNKQFSKMVNDLSGGHPHRLADFSKLDAGLYGSSEMFCNGFMQLIKESIVRREVFPDARIQKLLNDGKITCDVTAQTLMALAEAGMIKSPLSQADVAFLKRTGIFKPEVKWQDGQLWVADQRCPASLDDQETLAAITRHCLGDRLKGGIILHGGFFVGPRDFYQALRDMPPALLAKINMCRIGYITELFGQEEIARLQRKDARFVNTTMMVTLLGAAISDSLESGKLVSGVGGQYNFVAMAHALPHARSILNLHATRIQGGKLVSNIVWNYGHTTIPRHLRDIVVTEYGIADLRGQSDATVIKRMLAICDSRFQQELLETAKKYGKIASNYEIPANQRQNLPETLKARLKPWSELGLLPELPFGTDFTEDEVAIARALRKMKTLKGRPLELAKLLVSGLIKSNKGLESYMARMGLDHAAGLKLWLIRNLLLGGLHQTNADAGHKPSGQTMLTHPN